MSGPAVPSLDELAALVLPTVGDLLGPGWAREPSDGGDGVEPEGTDGLAALADACLPDGFPDLARRADAEVGFRRGGDALVLAMGVVFADRVSAVAAWHALGDEPFVRCFAESIAGEVRVGSEVELLGPLVTPGALTVARGARRTEQWRVSFAGAGTEGLAPVVLHLAVVLAGAVVVLLWAVDSGAVADVAAWEHLVEQAERRADVVVRTHAAELDP